MSKRNKIIVIVAAALVLLLVILVWWLISRSNQPKTTIVNQSGFGQLPTRLPVKPPASGINSPLEPSLIKDQKVESTVKAVAKTFAERFGSYSNQSNFENFQDIQDLLTLKMKGWVDSYIASEQAKATGNTNYYGISTLALSVKVNSFDASLGRAEVLLSTQRQEARGDTSNQRVFYQNLLLKMVKTDAGWKVDEANWQ